MLKPMPLPAIDIMPTVSVIVANYNYARFLPDAVESVLQQTYPNFELIICDDGSTDMSREILPGIEQQDSRITVLYKNNGGQASAWNQAIAHSSGKIISFLDPDDWFLPEKLERVVARFRDNPEAGMIYHRCQPTNADKDRVGQPFPRTLEKGWLAETALDRGGWGVGSTTSVISIRRELALELFPIPEEFRRGFGDAYVQACSQFLSEIDVLPQALTIYRIHDSNDSGALRPDLSVVTVMANARRDTFRHIHRFVADRFGESVAGRLRLEDLLSYWEYLAALYLMSGKPITGVHGFTRHDLLEKLPNTPRKKIWWGLFLLPVGIGQRAFQFWWGHAGWKRFTRPVTSLLRLG